MSRSWGCMYVLLLKFSITIWLCGLSKPRSYKRMQWTGWLYLLCNVCNTTQWKMRLSRLDGVRKRKREREREREREVFFVLMDIPSQPGWRNQPVKIFRIESLMRDTIFFFLIRLDLIIIINLFVLDSLDYFDILVNINCDRYVPVSEFFKKMSKFCTILKF